MSTVASNLAIAAAQISDQPVLLLDMSGTRPALGRRLNLANDLDLWDALEDPSQYAECIRSTPVPNLSLLGASTPSDCASPERRLRNSQRAGEIA